MTLSPWLGASGLTILSIANIEYSFCAAYVLETGMQASILMDDLIPLVRRCRYRHSRAFQVSISNTDSYKCGFFPLECTLSSAEGAEDSPPWGELGTNLSMNDCRLDVSTVNF